jgi:pyrimidine-nucleoside phosphorylase
MTLFRAVETIGRKRDGLELSPAEIQALVDGYVAGTVPDYQMAAFAMAVLLKGMTSLEVATLLEAMQRSGDIVTWPGLPWPTADKHSTGGVGDKISIPLAPAVAACGVAVPMISGRGLGHTGGTLDKLESIPGPGRDGTGGGFDVRLSLDDFHKVVADTGLGLIGQTERLVPADCKLYALRDVTATVESIPLIVASILSKKLAEGVASLVLDVKVGSGAFMKTRERAMELASAMVGAGQAAGRNVTAFLTAMDRPLGTHIGNALEIVESIHLLHGKGPADSRALVLRFGGEMLRLSGVVQTLAEGEVRIARSLDDGSALAKFREMLVAQGGDPRVADDPDLMPKAPVVVPLHAWDGGFLTKVDALGVGLAAVHMGAGRNTSADVIDVRVGFVLEKNAGDAVATGDVILWVHAADEAQAQRALAELRQVIAIGPQPPTDLLPLFMDVVER